MVNFFEQICVGKILIAFGSSYNSTKTYWVNYNLYWIIIILLSGQKSW